MEAIERLYALASELLRTAPNAFRLNLEITGLDGEAKQYNAVQIMREARNRIDDIDNAAMAYRMATSNPSKTSKFAEKFLKGETARNHLLATVAPPVMGRLRRLEVAPDMQELLFKTVAMDMNRVATRNTVHLLQAKGWVVKYQANGSLTVRSPWGNHPGVLSVDQATNLLQYHPDATGDDKDKTLADFLEATLGSNVG